MNSDPVTPKNVSIRARMLPWRGHAAALAARNEVSDIGLRTSNAKANAEREAEADIRRKRSLMEQYGKPILLAIGVSIVSFLAGQQSESTKLRAQDQRLSIENRRHVFASSAQEFGAYLTQSSRLRSITPAEVRFINQVSTQQKQLVLHAKGSAGRMEVQVSIDHSTAELKRIVERKERYILGRDVARDKLSGNFEQARLFFGPSTSKSIELFEVFDKQNSSKLLADLPPLDDWRKHANAIFEAMKKEIRDDESRLAAAPLGSATR